ncbi:MAG: Uma2 family endonuclease [Clostridia bacterium]|nr:Uma2 family endonuclease [Clostridia bacterium]
MASSEERVTGARQALPGRKLTYEEFLHWADEDLWVEWVDGEVEMVSPASQRHQEVAAFLTAVLRIYVRRKSLGAVLPAPFQVKLGPGLPGREPDLIFVAAGRLVQLRDTWFDGAPDVVVEIVSPESAPRDRGTKYYEYEAAGVREYWLIDPVRRQAEFHVLEPGGHYRLARGGAAGIFRSQAVEGFWLDVTWLWQDPLPDELDVLTRLLGPEAQAAPPGGETVGAGTNGVGEANS